MKLCHCHYWLTLLWLAATSLSSGEIILADGGKTDWRIVIADRAETSERTAAKELADYLKQSTGAEFVVVAEAEARPPACYVGDTAFARGHGIDSTALKPEEWLVRSVDGNLVFAGGRPRGVLYGVYEFLERFMHWRPCSINREYLPPQPKPVLAEPVELSGRPAFPLFRYLQEMCHNRPENYGRYQAHLRSTYPLIPPEYGSGVNYGSPRSSHTYASYSKDFPVEISWMNRNGQRVRVTKNFGEGQICYTHPEVRKRFLEKLRQFIAADRKRCAEAKVPCPLVYAVDANDCSVPCYCPECRKSAAEYGVSGMVLDFTNAVAAGVAEEYPDVKVMMFAYKETMEPPRKAIKARDNVIVRLAVMDFEFSFSPVQSRDILRGLDKSENRWYGNCLERWRNFAGSLFIWDYWKLYYDAFPAPKAYVRNRAELVRHYRDAGCLALYVEAEIHDGELESFADLRSYAGAKLMIDPDLDIDALIAGFMNDFYGPAGKSMNDYYCYVEKRMNEDPAPLGLTPAARRPYLDAEFFTVSDRLLTEAERCAAERPDILADVRQERLILDLAWLFMKDRIGRPAIAGSKAELIARVRQNFDGWLRKYFAADAREQIIREKLDPLLARLDAPPPPEEFANQYVVDFNWTDFRDRDLIADPDAAGGRCASADKMLASLTPPAGGWHERTPEMGIYDAMNKKHLVKITIPKTELPTDEKFHLRPVGRVKIGEITELWAHWSWRPRLKLTKAYDRFNSDTLYDCYVSVKFQGPAYVPGSKLENDVRVDRITLVKVTK